MGGFLNTLSQKLAERWFTLLVLPGALYLAAATTATSLGQAHALDLTRLTQRINTWAKSPAATTTGGQILALAAVLAVAASAGLAAHAIGRGIEHLVLAAAWTDWPAPARNAAGWLVDRRRDRWDAANTDYQHHRELARQARARGGHLDPARRDRAWRALARIAEIRPERPTWSGDRFHATARRLHDDLGLDIARIWPALWLTLPDYVRAEITTARTDLTAAATMTGWAALYAPLATWWWPAAPVAVALAANGGRRIRTTTNTYACLIEATVRLHTTALAEKLQLPGDGPATEQTGSAITAQLGPHTATSQGPSTLGRGTSAATGHLPRNQELRPPMP